MLIIQRRNILTAGLALLAFLGLLCFTPRERVAAEDLPGQIRDDSFWLMISDLSEPGGYFHSDNFVSNETAFQRVIPQLKKTTKRGGAYLGVGPDQNFTYLVALQPKIAFIIDIRRQNMLQHLMYKAVIELSADRAEFLSRLFSRQRPSGVGAGASAEALFQAYDGVEHDRNLFEQNLGAIMHQLAKHHGFKLTGDDEKSIEYVYEAFYKAGPNLTYSFSSFGFGGWRGMPTYAELMMETDGQGQNRGYLASEENFRILKELQEKNLVVPLVGDFAGDKAIRSVGRYLKEHGATVTVFYTSNVEQYLFRQDDDWSKFYSNVATLPMDSTSTFIRSVSNNMALRYRPSGMRSASLLSPIAELVKAFTDGQVRRYYDVIEMSR